MGVSFYGTEESMRSWRDIVSRVTGKRCGDVYFIKDKALVRHAFTAYIDEDDCKQLMNYWYEVEEGQDMPWNFRVSFVKR